MSDRFKPDANYKSAGVTGGYSSADAEDAADPTLIVLRLDPTTKRLLVDVNSADLIADGDAVDVANDGYLVLGTDGSNYQILATDSNGHLQVDVLSGGSGGTLVVDNEAVNGADTGQLILGTDGSNYQILAVDSSGNLQVDILNASIPVTGTFWQATQPVSLASVPSHAVTNAGTFAVQVNGDALTALQLIDNLAVAVDENYLNVNMNIAGADVSATVPMPVRPNEFELAGITTHVKKYYTNAGAVTDGIIWSPAAGKRWYVTDIFINVSAAATVTLEDDLAGGDSPIWKAELAANSGWSHSFNTPLYSGEDAADLIITTSAGNVYVTCVGYEI